MIDKKPIHDMPNKAFGDKHFASEFNTVKNFLLNTADAINAVPEMIESDFKGILAPSDQTPTEDGSYKPSISSELDKPSDPNSTIDWGEKYPNAGNLRAKSGYNTMFYKKGTVWTKSEVKIPSVSAATEFDPNNDLDPSTMKSTAERYDPGLNVLESFLADSITNDISSGYSSGYLKRDNTILNSSENKTRQNIDVTGYNKLYYKCYPAVITNSLASQYCAILGMKSDGTKVVIRQSALIPDTGPWPQSIVEETFDIADYVSISVSIGNLSASLNQIPVIKLIDDSSSLYKPDAVKIYVDEEIYNVVQQITKPKGPVILNQIEVFSSGNVTTGNATITNGILNLSGSNSYGTIKENTLNENSEMYILYKENAASSIIFGFNSNNAHTYNHHVFFRYNTNGTNAGKIEIIANKNLSYSQLSTTSNTNYTIGDLLRLGVIRKGLKYTAYVQNLTKGWGLKMEQICSPTGVPFFAHNTSSPAIISYSGSTSILEYKHISMAKDVDKAINGDSITFGQSASVESERYASRVLGNNIVMGGGADTTEAVMSRLTEIIKINPRRVLLMIGGNDILFNVTTSVWQQNLITIRNTLVNAGIEVVHLFPTPRAGASTLINFLKTESTFVRDVKLDVNTSLMNGNSDTLATMYDSGDHLHPNIAGHDKIAEIINSMI